MIKRFFDIFFSILGIVFFLPVFLIISLLIRLDSKGSVFFLQDRVGLNERIFKIIKFRTMKVNHNSKLTITVIDDDRITRIGSLIRRFKTDSIHSFKYFSELYEGVIIDINSFIRKTYQI